MIESELIVVGCSATYSLSARLATFCLSSQESLLRILVYWGHYHEQVKLEAGHDDHNQIGERAEGYHHYAASSRAFFFSQLYCCSCVCTTYLYSQPAIFHSVQFHSSVVIINYCIVTLALFRQLKTVPVQSDSSIGQKGRIIYTSAAY